MLKLLKNWTLPIAMLTGAIGYPLFMELSFLTPYLIFVMLLLTFCKVSTSDLKPKPLHLWLLLIQIVGALCVYLLLYRFNKIVAEGVMVCIICPTATAAAVITSKLGGSAASLTTYTLIGNVGAALAVPIFFPLIEVHPDINFWASFLLILGKVFPLLICPFLVAWLLEKLLPKVHHKLLGFHEIAFYLWAVSLAIVTAQTLFSLINNPGDGHTELFIALGALVACCLQFFLGKTIGSIYNDRISGGQALGQKNTILAIWMAHTYLDPLSSVAPGSYVLWQNIINSWQLWKKRKREVQ
ncbi:transporter [Bacteroides reticulotermitis]|uniref:BASS family bile acid:Na+ symporter n=1 Tax=Bacteroides reticulotermitis TaxID=1133319 RepID=A0A840CUB0_9BACE|nr:transporter [Bacteroides reticulotermitis]MBB4042471.1 BASS family bile acid:Na+ symporter [Bacteroides reticulotermitis]